MKQERSTDRRTLPARLRSVFRIFHPLDGLLPLLPFRPCFMPVTLLGFSLQSLSLTTKPSRLSASASLLPLSSRLASPASRPRPIAAPLASAVRRIGFARQKRWFRQPASGPDTSLESVAVGAGNPVRRPDALLGFSPLQGLTHARSGRSSPNDLLP
jgi:hypothetical protein